MIKYIFLLIIACFSSQCFADNLINSSAEQKALAAYEQAINKIAKGWNEIKPEQKINFKKLVKPKSEAQQEIQSTVWLNQDGTENVINVTNQENRSENLNWEHRILLDPSRFPKSPKLLKQTASTWVFEMPVSVGVQVENDQNVDENEVNSTIAKALSAELAISKANPRIVSHNIFSQKPFKPESMVTVNKFHIRMEYQEAWPNGPWVTQSISRKVEGKYALFISVNEFSSTTFTDFGLSE